MSATSIYKILNEQNKKPCLSTECIKSKAEIGKLQKSTIHKTIDELVTLNYEERSILTKMKEKQSSKTR